MTGAITKDSDRERMKKVVGVLFSVFLWGLALVALTLGTLGVASASEAIRFVTIADDSSYPLAPAGSLAVTTRVPTDSVKLGDTILVGRGGSETAAIGEVVAIAVTDSGTPQVTLKAVNRPYADQWAYELGASTYRFVAAVPLLGSLYTLTQQLLSPWVFAILASLTVAFVLVIGRFTLFSKPALNRDRWFMKLEKEESLGIDELMEQFEPAESEAPDSAVSELETRSKARRRKKK